VVDFISYVLKNNLSNKKMRLERHFETLND